MKSSYRAFAVEVAAIRPLSESFTRVTFTGLDLHEWGWYGADQRIKVVVPGSDGAGVMRTYTIRGARPEKREVDVDFVSHGLTGPATRWLAAARVGDTLELIGPDATSGAVPDGYAWRPGDARTLLLAADETAVPAVAVILEGLATDAVGRVFLEVPSAADILPLSAPDGVEITWLPRDRSGEHTAATATATATATTAELGFGDALVPAVSDWASGWVDAAGPGNDELLNPDLEVLWEVPEKAASGELYAWFAGEATAITTLRRHLVRGLGIDRSQVAFMGYWKQGRSES